MKAPTSNLPELDMSTSTTGCCPKFEPTAWDGKLFEFSNKPFLKDHTISFLHIPLNMGRVMSKLHRRAQNGKAAAKDFVLLSQDISPWRAEHYYAVSDDIPGEEIVKLSGTYFAKVYEGEFRNAAKWHQDLLETAAKQGYAPKQVFFYYTTCPKCAKVYGKNYVVGMVQI